MQLYRTIAEAGSSQASCCSNHLTQS